MNLEDAVNLISENNGWSKAHSCKMINFITKEVIAEEKSQLMTEMFLRYPRETNSDREAEIDNFLEYKWRKK